MLSKQYLLRALSRELSPKCLVTMDIVVMPLFVMRYIVRANKRNGRFTLLNGVITVCRSNLYLLLPSISGHNSSIGKLNVSNASPYTNFQI